MERAPFIDPNPARLEVGKPLSEQERQENREAFKKDPFMRKAAEHAGFNLETGTIEQPKKINPKERMSGAPARLFIPEKEEQEFTIKNAENFPELFKALDATGGLQGSQRFYTVRELKDLINATREGKEKIETITSTDGLRGKVIELLSKGR